MICQRKIKQRQSQNQTGLNTGFYIDYLMKITSLPEIIQLGLLKPEELIQIDGLIKELHTWEERGHSHSQVQQDSTNHKIEDLSSELFIKQEDLYNNIFGLSVDSLKKAYMEDLRWREKVTGMSFTPDHISTRFYERDAEDFEKAFEKASSAAQEPSLA